MKTYKRYFFFLNHSIFCVLFINILSGCSNKIISIDSKNSHSDSVSKVPDYSQFYYWAAHPWKSDPSDLIPAILQKLENDSLADVFFIHPTTLTSKKASWNAFIDDSSTNTKTDESSILYQASSFNEACRVFAPRYRQANLNAFFIPEAEAKKYFDLAYVDIKTAFEYYLQHYNNGRPIIIASHSQGTLHASRLLLEFFENKPLSRLLVCAYLLGLPVKENSFSSIKPCEDSLSTGCFVSWRTYHKGFEPDLIKKEKFRAVVTNPLSWTRDSIFVPATRNKGAVLRNFDQVVTHAVSAQVYKNILWSSKPNVPGKILLLNKNYHIGDINLFYMNIRQNVTTRIRAYLSN